MITVGIAIYLGAMLLAAISQVLLKKSAGLAYPNRLREYANRHVISAYALLSAAMLASLYAYRSISVSLAPILETAGIVFVAVLGRIFLGERLGRRKLAGILLILAGVAVVSFGSL